MTDVLNQHTSDRFSVYQGDCVETLRGVPDSSVDYSVFSPPFASLYTYSNSERDMGNCSDYDSFTEHYQFLIKEQMRTLKPGRLLSFHCMNLPLSKQHDGVIGIRDFRGDLIRMHLPDAVELYAALRRLSERAAQAEAMEDWKRASKLGDAANIIQDELRSYPGGAGFIYHSEVVIWKDPVTAMQRTKALGLLYKQLKKDSCMSRQGIPDYLVTMRRPGVNPDPVTKDPIEFPVGLWQNYASPVWFDINPSKTLQYRSAREHEDERHICPLQLEVIERAIMLWTNPDDVVLDPFGGIGSTGWEALRLGRRFIGMELKLSYYRQMVKNLLNAQQLVGAPNLFDLVEQDEVEAVA